MKNVSATLTQIQHLFVNPKSQFNLIKNKLSDIEYYIDDTNGYLRELLDDNRKRIPDLPERPDEDKERDYNHQIVFTDK